MALTTHFTDELMSQGLTKRILTLVSEISVTREFERLQRDRGLGNEKHRKEVRAIISYNKLKKKKDTNVFISIIPLTFFVTPKIEVCIL